MNHLMRGARYMRIIQFLAAVVIWGIAGTAVAEQAMPDAVEPTPEPETGDLVPSDDLVNEFQIDDDDITVDDSLDSDTWEPEVPSTPPEHTFNIEQVIGMALANSCQIKASAFDIAISETQSKQAWGLWLPKLSVTAYVAPAPSYSRPPGSNMSDFLDYSPDRWNWDSYIFSTTVGGLIPVYTFGRITAAMRLADVGVQAARIRQLNTRSEVIYGAKKAYYSLQLVNKLITILDEGLSVANSSRDTLQRMLDNASESVSNVDMYKLNVVIGELKTQLRSYRKKRELLMVSVRGLVGLPPNAPFYLAAPELYAETFDHLRYETYLDYTFSRRPDARLLDLGLKAFDLKKDLATASLMPNLFIAGYFTYARTPGAYNPSNPYFTDGWNSLYAAGFLGLQWEFDPVVQAAQYRRATLEQEQFAETRSYARLGITLQVRQAYETVLQKETATDINSVSLKAGKSWLLAQTMNYSIGLASTKDVINAISGYAKTQIQYYQALYEFNAAIAELDHLVGKNADTEQQYRVQAEPPDTDQVKESNR